MWALRGFLLERTWQETACGVRASSYELTSALENRSQPWCFSVLFEGLPQLHIRMLGPGPPSDFPCTRSDSILRNSPGIRHAACSFCQRSPLSKLTKSRNPKFPEPLTRTWPPRLPRSLLPRPRRRPHLPSPRRQQRHLMGRMVGLSRLHSCNSDVPHARTYVYILYMLRYTKTKSTGDDKAS